MQNFKPGQPLSIRLVTPDNKILVADAVTGYALTDNEREFIRICEPLTALSPNKREYRDICLGKLYQVKIADHEFCMPKGTVQFLGRGIYAQVVDPARPELASAPEEIVEDIWDARVINIAPDQCNYRPAGKPPKNKQVVLPLNLRLRNGALSFLPVLIFYFATCFIIPARP